MYLLVIAEVLGAIAVAIFCFIFAPIGFFVVAWTSWDDESHIRAIIFAIIAILFLFKISIPVATATWKFVSHIVANM